jgi:hypothetical protein
VEATQEAADDWLEGSAVAECLSKSSDIVSTGHTVHFADGRINGALAGFD